MINLILEKDKKRIRREYRRRLVVVSGLLSLVLFLTLAIGGGALYLVTHWRQATVAANLRAAEKGTSVAAFDRLQADLKKINEQVKILANDPQSPSPVSAIWARLIDNRRAGIVWRGLIYDRAKADAPASIALDGEAATRQQFLNFINVLKSDELFTDIEYPISSLINERDVQFVVNFKLANKK